MKQKNNATAKSVTKTVNVIIGRFGHEPGVKQECTELKHQNAYIYRSTLFPRPDNFGVKVVVDAVPVKVEGKNVFETLNPWRVKLTIKITGAESAVGNWKSAFDRLLRSYEAL